MFTLSLDSGYLSSEIGCKSTTFSTTKKKKNVRKS